MRCRGHHVPRLAELHLGGAIFVLKAELDWSVLVEGAVVEPEVLLKGLGDKGLLVEGGFCFTGHLLNPFCPRSFQVIPLIPVGRFAPSRRCAVASKLAAWSESFGPRGELIAGRLEPFLPGGQALDSRDTGESSGTCTRTSGRPSDRNVESNIESPGIESTLTSFTCQQTATSPTTHHHHHPPHLSGAPLDVKMTTAHRPTFDPVSDDPITVTMIQY